MSPRSTTPADFEQRLKPLLSPAAAYAYAILHDRTDAEDAVQDAAMKGYLALGSYDPSRPFKGWWFAVLRNCCRDLLRKRQSRPSVPLGEMEPAAPPGTLAGEFDDLRTALARLSPAHREVIELRYFGGCSYREIAAALEIADGTVMSRLFAARQSLAALYRKASP